MDEILARQLVKRYLALLQKRVEMRGKYFYNDPLNGPARLMVNGPNMWCFNTSHVFYAIDDCGDHYEIQSQIHERLSVDKE
jgi:hypothetical protein